MLRILERLKDQYEVFRRLIQTAIFDLRVAAPGIILSFDADRQTVEVQIAIRERITLNGRSQWMKVPVLVDVPIVIPRAGGFLVAPAIKAGDECLVIFSDCQFDHWWESGGVQNQSDIRRHDLSDGFAIIGTWSQPKKLSGYPTAGIQLRDDSGETKVEVTENSTINILGGYINIDSGGNTIIEGINFKNHVHGDPQGGTTGGPS